MNIGELFIKLGIIADETKAKDFFNIINEGKDVMFGLASTAVGTSISMGAMLGKATSAAVAMSQFHAQTGLSTTKLQEWSNVAKNSGATAQSMANSIMAVSANLADVAMGRGTLPAGYGMLGLPTSKDGKQITDPFVIMAALRKKAGSISAQKFTNLATDLGISPDVIVALKKTNAEFDYLANRDYIITPKQVDQLAKFNAELQIMGDRITFLFTKAFTDFNVDKKMEAANKWLESHKEEIVKGVTEIVKWTNMIAERTGSAVGGIDSMAKAIGGWGVALKAIVMTLALFNPAFATFMGFIGGFDLFNQFSNDKSGLRQKITKIFTGGYEGWISQSLGSLGSLAKYIPMDEDSRQFFANVMAPIMGLPQPSVGMGQVGTMLMPTTFNVYGNNAADLADQIHSHLANKLSQKTPSPAVK